MSRVHYTRVIHEIERQQIARQENELAIIEEKICHPEITAIDQPFLNDRKIRRSQRRADTQRHLRRRSTGIGGAQ